MAPADVIFLAGAPSAAALDWSDRTLFDHFAIPVRRYLGLQHEVVEAPPTQITANWRAISAENNLFYQSATIEEHNNQRAAPADSDEPPIDEDDDFLEHSFAVHADIQSSQLAPHASDEEDEVSTFITDTSIMSTPMDDSTMLPSDNSDILDASEFSTSSGRETYQFMGPIMNIKAIPNANHLQILQPQTMTVNLIAGVISVAPTRTVRVRRGNYDMEIIELTLGDETKAGFSISSWHSPATRHQGADLLRDTLRSLRPQDIVLAEQVALSSFKGQVFGQSLNRNLSKTATKITVICRSQALRGSDTTGYQQAMLSSHVAAKLQRVKDWVSSFIGPTNKRRPGLESDGGPLRGIARKRKRTDVEKEYLPPDSQT